MRRMFLGSLMDLSDEHPPQASLSMMVTSVGMTVAQHPATSLLAAVSMIALQLLRES